jgi:hypothetical protein
MSGKRFGDTAAVRFGETFGGRRGHETLDQRAQIQKKLQLRPVCVQRAMHGRRDVVRPRVADVSTADPPAAHLNHSEPAQATDRLTHGLSGDLELSSQVAF